MVDLVISEPLRRAEMDVEEEHLECISHEEALALEAAEDADLRIVDPVPGVSARRTKELQEGRNFVMAVYFA